MVDGARAVVVHGDELLPIDAAVVPGQRPSHAIQRSAQGARVTAAALGALVRALAYTIVTAALAGLYAGLVLLATEVLRLTSQVAVAAATLAAAALFNPLRRRVQHLVDRGFNRARYDADQTVTAFAARLKGAVDLDWVQDDLISVVQQTLEPVHISVSLSHRLT
jgi:hypothetical protein